MPPKKSAAKRTTAKPRAVTIIVHPGRSQSGRGMVSDVWNSIF